MRVIVFRHVPFEGLGLIESVLEERGIEIQFADLYREGTRAPDTGSAAGLIFMGGPMSVNDPLPYLDCEARIIRNAVEAGQPVLGVCLGAQLTARALGSRVYRNPVDEIGWFEIHLTEAGCEDGLLSVMSRTETVLQWHHETFDLPENAVWLARSEQCAHQAFRFGSNTYAFQFHLEVTPEMIADWCEQDANCGDVCELAAPLDPFHNALRLKELSQQVFGRWCALLNRR